MRNTSIVIVTLLAGLGACDGGMEPMMSKEEARAAAGKGDTADFCEMFGWYDDGVCDDFCADPDPDCDIIVPDPGADQWLSIEPVQCSGNPWQLDPPNEPPAGVQGEAGTVVAYLAEHEVEVLEIGFLHPAEVAASCESCGCPRGDQIVLRVSADDAAIAIAEGFDPFDGVALAPRQCGTNPWNQLAESGVPTEDQQVRAWLEDGGVSGGHVGFVHPTEPVAVCLACSCPRGDLLVVSPAADEDLEALEVLGFSPL